MANRADRKPDLGIAAVYRRLARNTAFLAAGTVASALFMMLSVVLGARALSAREFGLLVLFQSATMMAASLMSFSTQLPVIKLGSAAKAEGDMSRLGRIIGLGLLFDMVAATIAAVAAFAFLQFGRGLIGLQEEQLGLALPFAASLLFAGYLTSNGIFRLLDRFGLLSLLQTGSAGGIFAASAYLYASGAPFEQYCWAWAIFYVVNAQAPLFVAIYIARKAGIPITLAPGKLQPGEMSTFVAYCWTTWGTATAEALRSNGDSLLVGAAVSVESAGVYNVAKQLAGVLRKANMVYGSAMFPEITALAAHGEHENANRVRSRILRITLLVAVAAVSAAALFGRPALFHLFGSHFQMAYVPLIILTAAGASQLISHTLSMFVQVYVGPESLFRVYMFAMAIFLIAVFPLTSLFSIGGTAVAQLLFSISFIYFCNLALRRTDAA